jgi:isopentenyl diphosphate isomerase/L-lactate dehydrogenase-like FMN-dependent dehydrogenase
MALPEIVDAVAPNVTVMVDGGFRRGADVLKAIAMGASCVWVGRATLYGLAAGGEAGVARALSIFREEIDRAMALQGCSAMPGADGRPGNRLLVTTEPGPFADARLPSRS